MRGIWESWFGRSQWRDDRPARSVLVPGWLAGIGLLAAFAGGYLAGGRWGTTPGEGKAGLKAEAPVTPKFFEETEPLEDQAFLVAMYPELGDAEGRAQAKAFAAWLAGKDLRKAQPYLLPSKNVWTVAVYFANEVEQQATRDKLVALDDVPDRTFNQWRDDRRKAGEEWPRTWRTR
jgi:hypothetical protein